MKKIFATLLLLIFLTSFCWAWLNYTASGKKIKSIYLPHSEKKYRISDHTFKK
jgi:hypothetical protein